MALKAKSNDESTEQISLYRCVFSIRSAVGKKKGGGYIFICLDQKFLSILHDENSKVCT